MTAQLSISLKQINLQWLNCMQEKCFKQISEKLGLKVAYMVKIYSLYPYRALTQFALCFYVENLELW